MASSEQIIRTYCELAESYEQQGQAQMRDRFLVLAADAAVTAGRLEEAERLRFRLLQHNPHHLLKPYNSFALALKSLDVQNYISALRRSHPYERAEHLLETIHSHGGEEGKQSATGPHRPTNRPIAKLDVYALKNDAVLPTILSSAVPAGVEEREHATSRWVASGLFWFMLMGGVVLAIYALLRPLFGGA